MEVTRTWAAFVVALLLALPQPPRPALVITGAALGLILILGGSSAASRCRPARPRMRWGLVEAICCHFGGDLVVQALGPRIL